MASGVNRWNLVLDPGIGFALRPEQSFEIIRRLPEIRPGNFPLVRTEREARAPNARVHTRRRI